MFSCCKNVARKLQASLANKVNTNTWKNIKSQQPVDLKPDRPVMYIKRFSRYESRQAKLEKKWPTILFRTYKKLKLEPAFSS